MNKNIESKPIAMETKRQAIDRGKSDSNTIEYQGYVGRVEFDNDAELFHGEVINLKDVITFQGESVTELRQAFQDSVDDYLDFCAERGEKPEKPYSGKFVLRVNPWLHSEISSRAKIEGVSLNSWVNSVLEITLQNIHEDKTLISFSDLSKTGEIKKALYHFYEIDAGKEEPFVNCVFKLNNILLDKMVLCAKDANISVDKWVDEVLEEALCEQNP